ncbi:hypothetical protein [Streptomyces sp. NPDC006610]|uniref:hypothetical protein n=1 Tax=Streptomyces sp. NPDC006610 TaxID=3154584 RepID=UPI0033A6FB3D
MTDDTTELTAEETRALADDLGLQLYRAEDALAFVAECCTIAEREQRPITTADVREWLKGARCGRQLAADQAATQATDPASTPAAWTQLEARAFNAVQPALRAAGERLPLSARRAVARAVLTEILGPIPTGTDTATWTAVRAIQLMNEAGRERDQARATVERVRRLADEHIVSIDTALIEEALDTSQHQAT